MTISSSFISNIAVFALLCLLLAFALTGTIRKFRKGGGCCGEKPAALRRTSPEDRDAQSYPFRAAVKIGGMVCENCAARAENALNALPGVWAQVSFSRKEAFLRLKSRPDEGLLRQTLARAGFFVERFSAQ